MLAVLPQFINPHEPLLPQYLAITATMITVDMLVMAGYTGSQPACCGCCAHPSSRSA